MIQMKLNKRNKIKIIMYFYLYAYIDYLGFIIKHKIKNYFKILENFFREQNDEK